MVSEGDFGVDCENCECLTCLKNDDAICQNCNKCNGDASSNAYSRWKMNCRRYEECKNPEQTIKIVLGDIVT